MKSTDILVTLQEYRRKHPAKSISFEMEGELVAEVERLRDEADLLRTAREATRAYADRVEAEVLALRGERAAVVAWLREVADAPETYVNEAIALRGAALGIERGEHRREEGE